MKVRIEAISNKRVGRTFIKRCERVFELLSEAPLFFIRRQTTGNVKVQVCTICACSAFLLCGTVVGECAVKQLPPTGEYIRSYDCVSLKNLRFGSVTKYLQIPILSFFEPELQRQHPATELADTTLPLMKVSADDAGSSSNG